MACCDPAARVAPACGFRHEALFYADGDHGFLRDTLPLIEQALADRVPVLIAVGHARAEALREALDEAGASVRFLDMPAVGRNPARIIPVWQQFLDQHAGAPYALGVGEPVWPGRAPAELEECRRNEALLNLAFDEGPAWHLLCPYDLDELPDEAIEAARHTHPLLTCDGVAYGSELYPGPHADVSPFAGTLPAPVGQVCEQTVSTPELTRIRHLVGRWARQHELDADRNDELVLAVSELATNSICYGGGSCALRLWREQDMLMCEVQDEGRLDAPLAGRIRPLPEAPSGRGLWLVNQLCDLVQMRSAEDGSIVRIHKHLP